MHAHAQVTAPHELSLGEPGVAAGNAAEPARDQWRAELAAVGGVSPLLHFDDTPAHPHRALDDASRRSRAVHHGTADAAVQPHPRRCGPAHGEGRRGGRRAQGARARDRTRHRRDPPRHRRRAVAKRRRRAPRPGAPAAAGDPPARARLRAQAARVRVPQPRAGGGAVGAVRHRPRRRSLRRAHRRRRHLQAEPRDRPAARAHEPPGAVHGEPATGRLELRGCRARPRRGRERSRPPGARRPRRQHRGGPGRRGVRRARAARCRPTSARRRPTASCSTPTPSRRTSSRRSRRATPSWSRPCPARAAPRRSSTRSAPSSTQNKRVLVVCARRASLLSVADRLGDIGLPGLAVSPRSLRRDVIRSISRSEKAKRPDVGEVDDALVRLRKVLLDYRGALSRNDPAIGVSVLDCVSELSRLALLPTPPATTARLVPRLGGAARERPQPRGGDHGRRRRARRVQVRAGRLALVRRPVRERRRGAAGPRARQARGCRRCPVSSRRANHLIEGTHMRPYNSVDELGVYLRLFVDLRESLDRFLPMVFDRSITELIAATAPRRDFPDMSRGNRRRLKKLALEYVRPGVHVGDLHGALVRIQQQRVLWHRFVAEGATPDGAGRPRRRCESRYQRGRAGSRRARRPARAHAARAAAREPADRRAHRQDRGARRRVRRAAQPAGAHRAHDHPARARARPAHRGPRPPPRPRSTSSPPSSSWRGGSRRSSGCSEADRALLGANTPVLDRLEADFRLVDEAHASGNAQLLAWQLAENWKIGLVDWPDEADGAQALPCGAGSFTADDLQTAAPHLSRTIAPVWLASPYEVHSIADTMPFDTVVLVDAGATTLAENVGRDPPRQAGRRVRRPGDPDARARSRSRSPTPGHAPHRGREQDPDELHERLGARPARRAAADPHASPAATAPAARTSPSSSTAASTAGASSRCRGRAASSGTAASRSTTSRTARHARPRHRRRREPRRRGRSRRRPRARPRRHAVRANRSWSSPRAPRHAVRVMQAVLERAAGEPRADRFRDPRLALSRSRSRRSSRPSRRAATA